MVSLSRLSPKGRINLIEQAYSDLEITNHQLFIKQAMYAYNVLSYPEIKQEIFNDINELNIVSISLKFILEYLAATSSNGTETLDIIDYDNYLTTSYLITEWGYKKDLFQYEIVNTGVGILPSKRIGLKNEEFVKIETIFEKARSAQLINNSLHRIKGKIAEKESIISEVIDFEQLEQAFEDEFGFSFSNLNTVIWELVEIGEKQESEISRIEVSKLFEGIKVKNQNISIEILSKIVDRISLKQRLEFLEPKEPFTKLDVYPWRFNRELSFTRRPLIIQDNTLIWGNRSVSSMQYFLIDLINDGKLKAKSNKMKDLISSISTANGKAFNNLVFEKISSIDGLRVFKNVKKINKKRIEDEERLTLGDIDVLFIHDKKRRIVVVEVKNFNFSRNPYEMYCEYTNMFVDKVKKSYVTKHRRREEWVRSHLDDLAIEYGLQGKNWSVSRMFIVSEHLVSNDVYAKDERVITASEINLKNLL